MVMKKAKKLAETDEMKQLYPTIQNFKFSNKWLDGFISRNNLSNKRRTTISQKLPEDLIEQQHSFLSFILYRRIQYDYPLNLIANLDETPLSFDLSSSTILESKRSKTVSIRSTGHKKNCFTIVLTCMADGTKLEPVIIFKLKNILREIFSDGVKICVNEKGWVNEKEMLW
ncbi:6199_t:CDS:1 [Funneliformis geosporum]|nr:6199_t:CDS:1 [Funneliformis geosporum]